jgi:hypothetical protein
MTMTSAVGVKLMAEITTYNPDWGMPLALPGAYKGRSGRREIPAHPEIALLGHTDDDLSCIHLLFTFRFINADELSSRKGGNGRRE